MRRGVKQQDGGWVDPAVAGWWCDLFPDGSWQYLQLWEGQSCPDLGGVCRCPRRSQWAGDPAAICLNYNPGEPRNNKVDLDLRSP